jgi:hypothetical protein
VYLSFEGNLSGTRAGGTWMQDDRCSVATVITNVFQENEINLLRKFAKFVRIFDKIDDSKS